MPRSPFRRHRRIGPGGRTTRHPPDGLSPQEAEDRIADEPNEWMYVYAPDGTQIARFEGTPDAVDLSTDLMRFTDDVPPRSVLRDHVLVHNHPPRLGHDAITTYPLSPDDVALMVERDLSIFVVVSGPHRYPVRRPGEHWSGDERLYRGVIEAIRAELEDELGPTGTSVSDSAMRQHLALVRLRERGWIDYERTARTRQRR